MAGDGSLRIVINLPILLNPDRLLVWNKLEDVNTVKNSEVGLNLIAKGNLGFSYAKFGNGVQSTDKKNTVRIPAAVFPYFGEDSFTFEMWYQPSYGFGNIQTNRIDDQSIVKKYWLLDTHKKSYGLATQKNGIELVVKNDSSQTMKGTDIGAAYFFEGVTKRVKVVPGSIVRWNAGDLVHMAYVYDKNASERYIYVNGQLHASNTAIPTGSVPILKSWGGFALGARWNGSGENSEGVIDNLKVWDHAKTSFDLISE